MDTHANLKRRVLSVLRGLPMILTRDSDDVVTRSEVTTILNNLRDREQIDTTVIDCVIAAIEQNSDVLECDIYSVELREDIVDSVITRTTGEQLWSESRSCNSSSRSSTH